MSNITTTTIYGKIPSKSELDTVREHKTKFTPFGLNFPLGPHSGRGYFGKVTSIELLRGNVRQLLGTNRGERVMLPGYGVNLRKYLFQPLDQELFSRAKFEIVETIHKYTKFVSVLKIGIYSLDNFGQEGLQALKIVLVLQLNDKDLTQFDVEVDIV